MNLSDYITKNFMIDDFNCDKNLGIYFKGNVEKKKNDF